MISDDDLTDLSARNTMLMGPLSSKSGPNATNTPMPPSGYPVNPPETSVGNKLRKDPFNTLSTLVSSATGHARGRSVNVKNGKVYDEAWQHDDGARPPAFARQESHAGLMREGAAMGRREDEDDGDVGLRGWKSRGAESGFDDEMDVEARRPLRSHDDEEDTSYRGRGPWI